MSRFIWKLRELKLKQNIISSFLLKHVETETES